MLHLIVLGFVSFSALIWPASAPAMSCGRSKVSAQAAQRAVEAGSALLLDVREEDEIRSGMLKGAKWIPLSRLEAEISRLPQGKEVYVYCRSGGRAGRAEALLQKAGYSAKNLGGFSALEGQGFPSFVPTALSELAP
jgi:rhodanese-related sulfurtransferase